MGGLDGPPKPPALGGGPAEPGRPSTGRVVCGGLDGPPKPPPSTGRIVSGASTGPGAVPAGALVRVVTLG